MMDIVILNAFVIYNACKSHELQVTLREFRETVSAKQDMVWLLTLGRDSIETSIMRHSEWSRQLHCTCTCKVHTQRVDTIYSCAVCEVHMCPDPCFARYHYLENFAFNDPFRAHKDKTRKKNQTNIKVKY